MGKPRGRGWMEGRAVQAEGPVDEDAVAIAVRDASHGGWGVEAERLIRSLTLRVGRKGEDLMGVKHVNMH